MHNELINCPACGADIEISEILSKKVEGEIRTELEQEWRDRENKFKERQDSLKRLEASVHEREERLEDLVNEKVSSAKSELEKRAVNKVREEFSQTTAQLKEELEEKRTLLKEAQKSQLELQRKQRELEEQREALDLEVEKRVENERKKIREEALNQANDRQLLRMREKEDLIRSLQEKVQDLQLKIEQGSQERQGEVMEGELKDRLEKMFPFDSFSEIAKGKRGADILQAVRNPAGKTCGTILWESKNTKEFNQNWIRKLREDQQDAAADVAAIVSVAKPNGGETLRYVDDVWVSDFASFAPLAEMLRQTLIHIERERVVAAQRDSLKDFVYDYFTGPDFARRIKNAISGHVQMQRDLQSEQQSFQRIWKKRETQIKLAIQNTTEMFGEIEGLVAGQKQIPAIEVLQLESIASQLDGGPE